MAVSSLMTSPKWIENWLEESAKDIRKDPLDKASLDVHLALNELHDLYVPQTKKQHDEDQINILPTERRYQIFQRFERAAKKNSLAMFFAGLCRQFGIGTQTKAKNSGEHFVHVAAEWGCGVALNYLGIKNFRDAPEEAFRYFQQSAKTGYAYGCKNLGLCYQDGIGIAVDLGSAIKCFQAAGDIADEQLNRIRLHVSRQLALQQQNTLILHAQAQQPKTPALELPQSNVVSLDQAGQRLVNVRPQFRM